MLGPNDIEDFTDEHADLRGALRQRPEFFALKADPALKSIEGLDRKDFALLARFCRDEPLADAQILALIAALNGRA